MTLFTLFILRWHSHAGGQRADGIYGGLIVRQSKSKDVNGHLYDFDKPEHTVMLQDWANDVSVKTAINFVYIGKVQTHNPASILINGRGGQDSILRAKWCDGEEECPVPRYAQFDVSPKKRYRFRMISSGVRSGCGFRISVDQHKLIIIATDGGSIDPYECKSLVIYPGERYDFVLDATFDSGDFWMRVEVSSEKRCTNPSVPSHIPFYTGFVTFLRKLVCSNILFRSTNLANYTPHLFLSNEM